MRNNKISNITLGITALILLIVVVNMVTKTIPDNVGLILAVASGIVALGNFIFNR